MASSSSFSDFMSVKGFVSTAILFSGFIAFTIGVPSYSMIYMNPGTSSSTNTQPSFSYMGACDDSTQYDSHCASLTSDFWHCMNGDKNILTYNYNKLFWGFDPSSAQDASSNRLDETLCARIMTCEAFGLMAIILSFFSVVGVLCYKVGEQHQEQQTRKSCSSYYAVSGGVVGLLASFFGSIALAIFFSSKPEIWNNMNGVYEAHHQDISGFVTDGTLKLGYSTGLQIAGIIASFIGGCMAFAVDFNSTSDKQLALPMTMTPGNNAKKFHGSSISGTATPNTNNDGTGTGNTSARLSGVELGLGLGHPAPSAAAAAASESNAPAAESNNNTNVNPAPVQWHA